MLISAPYLHNEEESLDKNIFWVVQGLFSPPTADGRSKIPAFSTRAKGLISNHSQREVIIYKERLGSCHNFYVETCPSDSAITVKIGQLEQKDYGKQ